MTWKEAIDQQIRENGHDFRKLKCDYREVYWEKVAKVYARAAIEADRQKYQDSVMKSVVATVSKEREINLP